MSFKFVKMHGLGNDFVVVDGVRQSLKLSAELIRKLADRHRGIGFDQFLLIQPATGPDVDFNYRIFNADGGEVEQCGNGARCMARFIREQGLSDKQELSLQTKKGILKLILEESDEVTVEMGVPQFEPERIPFLTQQSGPIYQLEINHKLIEFTVVNIGNPHMVIVVEDTNEESLGALGQQLMTHASFPEGINVGFMQVINPQLIRLRVFERGVGFTQACGSGACAAMILAYKLGIAEQKLTVRQPGGDLRIYWPGPGKIVKMSGPAQTVYLGEYIC